MYGTWVSIIVCINQWSLHQLLAPNVPLKHIICTYSCLSISLYPTFLSLPLSPCFSIFACSIARYVVWFKFVNELSVWGDENWEGNRVWHTAERLGQARQAETVIPILRGLLYVGRGGLKHWKVHNRALPKPRIGARAKWTSRRPTGISARFRRFWSLF